MLFAFLLLFLELLVQVLGGANVVVGLGLGLTIFDLGRQSCILVNLSYVGIKAKTIQIANFHGLGPDILMQFNMVEVTCSIASNENQRESTQKVNGSSWISLVKHN